MKRWVKGLVVGACLGLGSALFALTPFGVALEENVGLAWLFKIRGPLEPPPDVVVAGVDKRSADALGLPSGSSDIRSWPRSLHGRLIDVLVQRGASIIVFDIAFNRARSADEDAAFAAAMARSCRVLLFESMEPETKGQGIKEIRPFQPFADAALALAPFPLPKETTKVSQFWAFFLGADHMPTLPAMALQAYALGALEEWPQLLEKAARPEVEGPDRNAHCPALRHDLRALAHTFRRAFKENPDAARGLEQAVDARQKEGVVNEKQRRDARALSALLQLYRGPDSHYLNFYGPPGTIPTIPYHVLLSEDGPGGREDAIDVAGKAVFVGYSEQNMPAKDDSFYTVFTKDGIDLSGVEIAATAFANFLNGQVLAPTSPGTTAVIVVLFGGTIVSLFYVLPATMAAASAVSLAAAYAVGAQIVFGSANLWMPLATPLLAQLPLALLIGLLSQYGLARQRQDRMQRALGHYLPPRVAQGLADHPVDPISVREPVYAACLAADAENFTSLAEGMTPEASASYLNSYFDALAEAVSRHRSDIMTFRVNGAMCAWTASGPDPAVRARACVAALAAVEAINGFNARCPPLCLEVGIGLHAGSAFLGHVGGGGHFDFEIVGDIPNTAVRIEEFNRQLGTRVLATEAAVADLDDFLFRPLGAFLLKGKKNATAIVEIVAAKDRASMAQMALCGRFAVALAAFQKQDWQQAAEQFEAILASYPDDGPSRFYLDNCRSRRKIGDPEP